MPRIDFLCLNTPHTSCRHASTTVSFRIRSTPAFPIVLMLNDMALSSEIPTCRSAVELRIAFRSMAALRLPRAAALEKFDTLWDEVNGAAMRLSGSNSLVDYVALLKEMQAWYAEVLHGPV